MNQSEPTLTDLPSSSTSRTDSRSSSEAWNSECHDHPSIPQHVHYMARELRFSEFDKDSFSSGYVKEKEDSSTTEFYQPNINSSGSSPIQAEPLSSPIHIHTCTAQFLSLSALNQTVAPVLILAKSFGVEDYRNLSWFSASYSMSVGTFILPTGRLGDMYGHKRIYLIDWLWFSIWSLITGFSYTSNHIMFSVCRALQGIGPALLVPNAVALIGRTLPVGKQRMIGFACFGACDPLGATAGAVFSALIAERGWWPCMFWVLAAVCLIVMGLAYIILPAEETAPVPATVKANLPKFDYWGFITGVSGLVLINTALNQASLVLWTTLYVSFLLGAGVLLMIAFLLVELHATIDPLIPIRGLGKEAVFALTCIVTGWASHGIWVYYLYHFLEHLRGYSALLTLAQTSPVAVAGVLFAFSTVWLTQRCGVNCVMFIAMTLFMFGALLLATMPLDQTYWAQTFVSVIIMPGAIGLSYPAANVLMSASLPKEKQGIAASLVSTLVNYSISCGLGCVGSARRFSLRSRLVQRGLSCYAALRALEGHGMRQKLTSVPGGQAGLKCSQSLCSFAEHRSN
ncbi:MFS general substrate transporter [Bimuria novae-zelandiae CBS 107.79]|uniref:MFS general substrate transporter n=1 Tax=Bimuria novae-zelandiae CBS 107.79 TaxID=1447943 RepID=A0A6A5V6P2_9PLEO|nr:MFS general substrate transporter [Bimuria novae-zelandiae CBS 107.79]